jgi:hypothetical protein
VPKRRLVLGWELGLAATALLGLDALPRAVPAQQVGDELARDVEPAGDLELRHALVDDGVEDLLAKIERVRLHPKPLDRKTDERGRIRPRSPVYLACLCSSGYRSRNED